MHCVLNKLHVFLEELIGSNKLLKSVQYYEYSDLLWWQHKYRLLTEELSS